MKISIGKLWQDRLARLPESGMGSQHVDIVLKRGRVLRDVTVFNGEHCEVDHPFDVKEIVEILLHRK